MRRGNRLQIFRIASNQHTRPRITDKIVNFSWFICRIQRQKNYPALHTGCIYSQRFGRFFDLNRKPVTIRSWEAKGWIPPASFRTPAPKSEQIPGKAVKGRRLYSEAQIVFLVEAAMAYAIDDPDSPDWKGFRKHIADNYPTT